MMTPFEIKDELAKIERLRKIGDAPAARQVKHQLHAQVLQEIADGCLDPRSLAMAVLEID